MKGTVESLIATLDATQDKRALRRTAQALGDLTLTGGASDVTSEQRKRLDALVTRTIERVRSKRAEDRVDAKEQLERLWKFSADPLVNHIDDKNLAVAEAAAKSLILMRDEKIVRKIIEKLNTVQNERSKILCLFVLGKMREHRTTIVQNRHVMPPAESKKLAETLIVPALQAFVAQESSAKVRQFADKAITELSGD